MLAGVRRVGCHGLVAPGLGQSAGPVGREHRRVAESGQGAVLAGRAGSRSRWVSRPSRPGTAANRSITAAMLRGVAEVVTLRA